MTDDQKLHLLNLVSRGVPMGKAKKQLGIQEQPKVEPKPAPSRPVAPATKKDEAEGML